MKQIFLLFFFFFCVVSVSAQRNYSGNVIDAWDKKYLEGVVVSHASGEKVSTNSRGYFSIPALQGDTLLFQFPGFLEKKIPLTADAFLFVELQDLARLLPTFQVKAEPYRFRFKDGKLYLSEDETVEEKRPSQQVGLGAMDPNSPLPNFGIYGPISYFTKRNRELRAYEKRLDWERQRVGYLEVIDADSVRTKFMQQYGLDRKKSDELILRFNTFHASHEFLGWSKDRVVAALSEFFRLEFLLED
ncbi:MAG: hypothetical protein O2829_06610 [Bacteroidetes bacterium]|nr:hypothetical protein [Bacteroidota bacterium]